MRITRNALRIVGMLTSAAVLIVVLVVAYLSGSDITIEGALSAIGVFIAGLLAALGWRRGGGMVLCAALAASTSACSVPAWQVARSTIQAAHGAMDATASLIPEDVEHRDEILSLAGDAFDLGDRAVDIWAAAGSDRPPQVWSKAVAAMVYAAAWVMDLVKALGVPVPDQLQGIMAAVQMLATMA